MAGQVGWVTILNRQFLGADLNKSGYTDPKQFLCLSFKLHNK